MVFRILSINSSNGKIPPFESMYHVSPIEKMVGFSSHLQQTRLLQAVNAGGTGRWPSTGKKKQKKTERRCFSVSKKTWEQMDRYTWGIYILYIYIHLSYLCIYLSIYLPIYLSIYLSICIIRTSIPSTICKSSTKVQVCC